MQFAVFVSGAVIPGLIGTQSYQTYSSEKELTDLVKKEFVKIFGSVLDKTPSDEPFYISFGANGMWFCRVADDMPMSGVNLIGRGLSTNDLSPIGLIFNLIR